MVNNGYEPRLRLYFNRDETKFELWETKFLGYLRIQKLHDIILCQDDQKEDDDFMEKNATVFAELIQFLDDRSLSLIMREAKDNGRRALQIMQEHYFSKGKPKIIALYTELTALKRRENESVTDYTS